jgi:hypothetical protein
MNKMPSRSALIDLVATGIDANTGLKAVVYVFKELLQPGGSYNMSRKTITAEQTSVLLFVDQEPGVNWSHQCLYIVYDGNNIQKIPAEFPPPEQDLLLLIKPDDVKDWQLLNTEIYNG